MCVSYVKSQYFPKLILIWNLQNHNRGNIDQVIKVRLVKDACIDQVIKVRLVKDACMDQVIKVRLVKDACIDQVIS